ncbi:SDR family oxidoreductase [Dehalococcoidia bacterium]|nr:SDR family oxidoreductase [Dehalococcoidia bacterium]
MLLKNQVAIITGGGNGVGREAAIKFAKEGAAVVVAARSPDLLEETVGLVEAVGGKALAVPADISIAAQVQNLIDKTTAEFGQVDVMINNASYPGPWIELAEVPLEEWDYVQGTIVRGTMLCTKFCLPHMISRKSGNIIQVSSTAGRRGLALKVHYSTAKLALIGFTRGLAAEVGKYNIRTNCIVPGAVMTDRLEKVFERAVEVEGVTYEEAQAGYTSNSPMGRIVEATEVADLMIYLASDLSKGIHGQSIDINAGSHMV